MKLEIDVNDFVKHLMFWSNKTDDECIEMATSEQCVNAEQALLNILERDFCIDINKEIANVFKKIGNENNK